MSALEHDAQLLLDEMRKQALTPIYKLSIADARQRLREAYTTRTPELPCIVWNDDFQHGGLTIPLRVYKHQQSDSPQPCLLFFHGGGWTLNDLDTHDNLCRSIAKHAGCTVIAVDFRKAPEHTYPAAVNDSVAALEHIWTNHEKYAIDRNRIAVGGDSSGGYQAILVAVKARDMGGLPIIFQWIVYPITDYYEPFNASYMEAGENYSLTAKQMVWFWNNFLPGGTDSIDDPYVFPLKIEDLSNLPPSYFMLANCDPLRDEGIEYAEKLAAFGNSVKYDVFNQMHGFLMQRSKVPSAQAAFLQSMERLQQAFL